MIKGKLRDIYMRRSGLLRATKENSDAISRMSWSRERMDEYSFDLARSLVDFAFSHVPFYQMSFKEAGYEKGALQSWTDFERLPVLTKSKLREAIKDKSIFATDKAYKFTKTSTTGSTGEPLTLYFDHEGIRQRETNLRRLSYLFSMDRGEPVVQLWRKKAGGINDRLAEYLGIRMTIPVLDVDQAAYSALDERAIDAIVDKVIEFKSEVLRGYVSALDSISQRVLGVKKTIPTLRHVITAAEAMGEDQWKRLEAAYCCPVHNLYGGTEAPCIAVNIGASHEMSIFDDYYRLEIIEEESVKPCVEGVGRILITDYFMHGMPLIRYENGDLAEFCQYTSNDYPFRSLSNVLGRINDKFILPNGKVVYSHLWHIFFRDLSCINRFRVTQATRSTIDIELEPTSHTALSEKIPELNQRVSKSLGADVELNWSIVDHIPLDKGAKFRAVRSLVTAEVAE